MSDIEKNSKHGLGVNVADIETERQKLQKAAIFFKYVYDSDFCRNKKILQSGNFGFLVIR